MPVALRSSFPIPVVVDLDFRPDSYVADWCALAAAIQNVTGERRRWEAHRVWCDGSRRRGLSDRLRADSLAPDERERYIAVDPRWRVSGEYLPPYLPGELEIARLVVATTPRLVYSLRARANLPPGKRPHFGRCSHLSYEERRVMRLVDEQGTKFELLTDKTSGTLSLRELIVLTDSVIASNLPELPRALPFPEALLLERVALGESTRRLGEFVTVSSTVYPELYDFYRERLNWWLQTHFSIAPSVPHTRRSLARTLGGWWREREE